MYLQKSDINGIRDLAKKYNNTHVWPETTMLYLLEKADFYRFFTDVFPSVSVERLKKDIVTYLKATPTANVEPEISFDLEIILKRATTFAAMNGENDITYSELMLSIGESETTLSDILSMHNVVFDINTIEELQTRTMEDQEMQKNSSPVDDVEFQKHTILLNEEVKKNPKAYIKSIGVNEQLQEIQRTFLRKQKNSIIVTGEPGVGKSNIVDSFVVDLVNGDVHPDLKDLKVYSLSLSSLLSDIKYHGILEARVNSIINVLVANPNYVLFIDEIHMINGAGGSNSNNDIMNFLKAPLSKNKIKVIGATTTQEYNKFLGKNPAFQRRFTNIVVKEPNHTETVEIIQSRLGEFVKYHDIKVKKDVIDELVTLTNLYIKNRFNPDKSIDILDAMMARKRLNGGKEIVMADVFFEIARECRIPSDEISITKYDQIQKMHDTLKKRIIGQDKAFDDLRDILMVSMAGLREKTKTLGNFLFQGMTSSGKTETAKLIAESLGIPLIRYDMSGYQEKHTVNTLIGSPPGYLGFGDTAGNGRLINDIENNPNCVLLLDEIEKAHPEVLTILLQIMDYGKLSSSAGKDVYFNKVIVVMTSNLGSRDAEKPTIGFGNMDKSAAVIDESINRHLTPEFRARLDSIIKFKSLTVESMEKIVEQQISDLNVQLSKQNIQLELTEDAMKKIAKDSHASKLGARNIQTVISKNIKTHVAKILLTNPPKKVTYKRIVVNENGLDVI